MLFEGSPCIAAATSVADIRLFEQLRADDFNEIGTEPVACKTSAVQLVRFIGFAFAADVALITGITVFTGVVVYPLVADSPEDKMPPDFFGNGGAVFAEGIGDLGEGRTVVQHGLDDGGFLR